MNTLDNLEKSKFRSRFHLKEKDINYINDKGINIIKEHAYKFINERLKPSYIKNDGKQTPYNGHPVFISQHATACCCRGCLNKWHNIAKNRELIDVEINDIVDLLMKWIEKELHK